MNNQIEDSITFYTDIRSKQPTEQSKLRKYVDKLTDKIQYAKWKQDLVLKFNYMPITDMIEKLKTQKIIFQKKIADEQQKCRKVIEDKQMLQQLKNFKKFSKMLDIKMQELQNNLMKASKRHEQLKKQVKIKKKQLERQTRQIMTLKANKLKNKGIQNFDDILNAFKQNRRGISTNNQLLPADKKNRKSVPSLNLNSIVKKNAQNSFQNQERAKTERKTNISSIENKITVKRKRINSQWKQLFVQCLNSILQEENLALMSHRDHLEQRSKNSKKKQEIFKIKKRSHSQFQLRGQRHIQFSQRVAKNFECNWENFQHLSWKQILRYVLSLKGGAQKMRNLL